MLIQGFSNFTFEAPACHPGVTVYGAGITLDVDVSHLFPYLNAVAEQPTYYEKPHYIQFALDGRRCALYPKEVSMASFRTRDEAFQFIECLIAFLNDIDARTGELTPNPKMHQPIKVMDVFKLLPRTNCKACGQATCLAFAAAVSKGEAGLDRCPELLDPQNPQAEELRALLG